MNTNVPDVHSLILCQTPTKRSFTAAKKLSVLIFYELRNRLTPFLTDLGKDLDRNNREHKREDASMSITLDRATK